MSLKYGILFVTLISIFSSCSNNQQFPLKYFEKVDSENVVLNNSLWSNQFADSTGLNKNDNYSKELGELILGKNWYEERNREFNLAEMENRWKTLENKSSDFGLADLSEWIEVTGFLLEISGNPIYASELERILYQSVSSFPETDYMQIEKWIVPWIYTKNVDHIRVNVFANSTIKYEHTLKGAVEIMQETNYPDSNEVKIKFKMENKRYIEIFIRIPDWAENITVTEKGVKYVANPGSYSQIVRKWSDGDVIEIKFSTAKKPDWLNTRI